MPGSSQDILAQNNINRFQLTHLFRDIVNVDVNDIFSASTTFSQKTFPICRSETMWTLPLLQGDNDVDAGDYHEAHLIFVIFFTQAKFLENKIYTEKTHKLRQNTQEIANFFALLRQNTQ